MNVTINTKIFKDLRERGLDEETIIQTHDNLRIVVCTGPTSQVYDRHGNHVDTIDIDHTDVEQYQKIFWR